MQGLRRGERWRVVLLALTTLLMSGGMPTLVHGHAVMDVRGPAAPDDALFRVCPLMFAVHLSCLANKPGQVGPSALPCDKHAAKIY